MSAPEDGSVRRSARLRGDALVILGWFAVLGLVAGLVWWKVTPVPQWVRTAQGGSLDEAGMGQAVGIDGWFATLAAVGGLVSGVLLTCWRGRSPIATVLLVLAGAAIASGLMLLLGHELGTHDLDAALRRAPVGGHASAPLTPTAWGVLLVWPATAMVGALGVNWVLSGGHHATGSEGIRPGA